jgi:Ca2+-binding EF-hand superfamily protein
MVGEDVALRDQTANNQNNESPKSQRSNIAASVCGLLLVLKPDGDEVQIPFSRTAAGHHVSPALLEKWSRDLADSLRYHLNPDFAAGKDAAKAIFSAMDTDSSRDLSSTEIYQFMQNRGVQITREQVEEMFARIDLNQDGLVSLEEFEHHLGIRNIPVQEIVIVHTSRAEQLALEEEILQEEIRMHEEVEELFDQIDADGCVFVCVFVYVYACVCVYVVRVCVGGGRAGV